MFYCNIVNRLSQIIDKHLGKCIVLYLKWKTPTTLLNPLSYLLKVNYYYINVLIIYQKRWNYFKKSSNNTATTKNKHHVFVSFFNIVRIKKFTKLSILCVRFSFFASRIEKSSKIFRAEYFNFRSLFLILSEKQHG